MKNKKQSNTVNRHTSNTNVSIDIDVRDVKQVYFICKAYNHPLRLKLLKAMDKIAMTVKSLHKKLRIPQSTCSLHLARLRKAGLVKTHREGKYIFYSISPEGMYQFADRIQKAAQ